MQVLPLPIVNQIRKYSDDYCKEHKWAEFFLRGKSIISEPAELDGLDDDEKVIFLMILTRFDSFKKKYGMPSENGVIPLTNSQLVYAITMMLSGNSKERQAALVDAQDFIEKQQQHT